ncbi:MAG: peptidoglycan-binding domain-containing protein [Terracidiphilus sp.]|nr:peptidoglycan-binding domain-containing protein [Terracidiphilus sp.]
MAFVLAAALGTSPAVAARAHRSAHSSHSHAAAASAGKKSTGSSKRSASADSATVSGSTSTSKGRKARVKESHRLHGQQGIDSARATEIQQALIREHYMSGEPTGSWDSTTQAAMQKYQADQGWQTKLLPDSRALVKLGLGPDYSGAINAKTGNFVPPPPDNTLPAPVVAGFAAGSRAATVENH